jgi:hypothetical protein
VSFFYSGISGTIEYPIKTISGIINYPYNDLISSPTISGEIFPPFISNSGYFYNYYCYDHAAISPVNIDYYIILINNDVIYLYIYIYKYM